MLISENSNRHSCSAWGGITNHHGNIFQMILCMELTYDSYENQRLFYPAVFASYNNNLILIIYSNEFQIKENDYGQTKKVGNIYILTYACQLEIHHVLA